MAIDPSTFYLYNITDTCAVWNVLSSVTLYRAARLSKVSFVCTRFVLYECLHKPRTSYSQSDDTLQSRLRNAQAQSDFTSYPLDISDLQTIQLLENRKKLGKGELSAIAFALKVHQAFLSDDQNAKKLGREVLEQASVQTTPHLLAWLFYFNQLTDSDHVTIIKEHKDMNRPLSEYFHQAYLEACRCRLMTTPGADL